MTFKEFLENKNLNPNSFAKKCGIERSAAYRYLKGGGASKENMKLIKEAFPDLDSNVYMPVMSVSSTRYLDTDLSSLIDFVKTLSPLTTQELKTAEIIERWKDKERENKKNGIA